MDYLKKNLSPLTITVLIYVTLFLHGGFFSGVRLFLCVCVTLLIVIPNPKINVDLTAVLLFFVFVLSVVSSVVKPVNAYVATLEILKYVLTFLAYLAFLQLSQSALEKIKKAFLGAFLVLGLFGFFAWSGALEFTDALTASDRRVQSFLQYANTTALCTSVCFLLSADAFRKEKKIFYALSGAFSLFILYLTQSRTAIALLAVAVVAYLFIQVAVRIKKDKRKLTLLCGCTFFAVAFTAFFARAYVVLFLRTGTFVERLITFYDAAVMLLRSPFLGVGAGGWQSEHFVYQSGFYAVRYVHNFYLQVALDAGLPALLALMVPTVCAIVASLKKHDDVVAWVFVLLMAGNVLEFHMNYGIVTLLFAFCLAWLLPKKTLFSLHIPQPTRRVAVGIALVLPLCVLWVSEFNFDRGKRLMDEKRLTRAISAFELSLALNPFNYQAVFNVAKCELDFDKAMEHTFRAYQMNPKDLDVVAALADGHVLKEDWGNAIRFSEEVFGLNPRRVSYQNLLADTYKKAFEAGFLSQQGYDGKTLALSEERGKLSASRNKLYGWVR